MIVPVILSGGAGSRLWPLSRELHPKQFLTLVDGDTLLQNTVKRLIGISNLAAPIMVCNGEHRFMVAEQLRFIGTHPSAIVLEPEGHNTAPAITIATLQAVEKGQDPLLLVLPADHVIRNIEAFQRAVATGAVYAAQGKLITFGIIPQGPETGYGYIKQGDCLAEEEGRRCAFYVEQFVEKPDLETAQGYIDSGEYAWNSGMFMFRASRILEELERYAPDMLAACRNAYERSSRDLDFVRLDAQTFAQCPRGSLDTTVMEKTTDAVVIPMDAGWSDVGSWSALWEIQPQDEHGNVVMGDVLTYDVHNSFLHAEDRLLAVMGVDDQVIVETADAVLVAHKSRMQEVKDLVVRLRAAERSEALTHRRVLRPWGAYESIDSEDRFQVKRLTVNPGASLSMQLHYHRAEHWVVVKGTARIMCGEKTFMLSENQSTYIPVGIRHRLENPGKIPLEIIEVQSGGYLGEDDIVRFEDDYGRVEETAEKGVEIS